VFITRIICIASLLFNALLFCGFPAGTLVQTPTSYVPIEQLHVGDKVVCLDSHGVHTEQKITHTLSYKQSNCICIIVDSSVVITCHNQQLYIPDQKIWKRASDLISGDCFWGDFYKKIVIKEIIESDQEIILYDITVQDCHNFLISPDGILVHNFVPAVAIGISWIAGVFSAEAVSFSLSVGLPLLGGFIGFTLKNRWRLCAEGEDSHNKRSSQVAPLHIELPAQLAPCVPTIEHEKYVLPTKVSVDLDLTYSHAVSHGISSELMPVYIPAPTSLSLPLVSAVKACTAVAAVGVDNLVHHQKQKAKNKTKVMPGSQAETQEKPDNKKPKCPFHAKCSQFHPHGLYQDAGYHHKNSGGKKSPAPADGQLALDFSVTVDQDGRSSRRIGISCGQIVVLSQTGPALWHGHVRPWGELIGAMKTALEKQGWANYKGKMKWPKWAI